MPIEATNAAGPGGPVERRVALVIGNGGYQHASTLENPTQDARGMVAALRALRFEVLEGFDLTVSRMDEVLSAFAQKIDDADAALLFYAGHGLQVNGENYLVPIDAELDNEGQLNRQTIKLQDQLDMMSARARVSVLLLDCCRDNPFVRSLGRLRPGRTRGVAADRGLAEMETTEGSFIAFATGPGSVAEDGEGGHSPFTAALLAHIDSPGQSIADIMTDVTNTVASATNDKQVPWYHSSLRRRFILRPLPAVVAAPVAMAAPVVTPADPTKQTDRAVVDATPVAEKTEKAGAEQQTEKLPSAAEPVSTEVKPRAVEIPAVTPRSTNLRKALAWALTLVVIAAVGAFAASDRLWTYLAKGPATVEVPDPAGFTEASQRLIARIDMRDGGLGDALRQDVVNFILGPAPDRSKQQVLSVLAAMAQSYVREVTATDPVPSNCRAPTPNLRPGDNVRTLVCSGLADPDRQGIISILAALPPSTWSSPEFSGAHSLIRLAVADIAALYKSQSSAAVLPGHIQALSDNVHVTSGATVARQVTLQFAGDFQRGNAQAIMDRLVSFGWNLGGVQRDGGAAGLNEIRYGNQAGTAEDAKKLSADLALQGLTVTPKANAAIGAGRQLDIYISTPLALWDDKAPQFAWCYQEYDPSKSADTRYLVACHPSQMACADARGNPSAKTQSACIFREDLSSGNSILKAGGWAKSWFAEAGAPFQAPFPALPPQ
ncbi:caspase domain-containing protein [Mesorhizobium sp. RCC_202]|uniref:caspase family protein n=1 Tax=Mesorhizobium sp. RCC_202 TaxID=3239222 RepID=UPI003525815F